MIADDVHETRRSVRLMLSTINGVEVVAIAQNGRQAIDLAGQTRPDMVFMDVNMPEMDGLSAIRVILQRHPETVCIIISAERDSDTLRQAIAAGARGYLIKPFTSEELEQTIQEAMQLVVARRQQAKEQAQLTRQRYSYLKQLAYEYASKHRTDDQALEVFEQLSADPDCEMRWLMTLGMIYIVRKDWTKLRMLAERLESQAGSNQPA